MNGTDESRRGLAAALSAYFLWGLFPLYFKMLAAVPPLEVLCQRVFWSALLTVGLVLLTGKGELLVQTLRNRRRLAGLTASAFFISVNWGFYIYAVGAGRALEAGMGYFVYPLFSVAFGALFLKERLNLRQSAAVFLVCLGVAALAVGLGKLPWLVLVFPLSFGPYGLLRKVLAVDALVGLTVECLVLLPLALIFLVTRPGGGLIVTGGAEITFLLVLAGPVTALPLVLFAYGARRLSLATVGLMQYLNPSLQTVIAVLLFGEPFTRTHAVTFTFIWLGLLLYSWPARRLTAAEGMTK